MNDAIRMQISAFVDGELPDNEAELLLRRLSTDAELRQVVADFLDIGRAMRAEQEVAGMAELRGRITAAIGDETVVAGPQEQRSGFRFAKPLAGVAVAASVALLAIVGLQQSGGPEVVAPAPTVAATEPQADELIDEYFRHHRSAATGTGSTGPIGALVGYEINQSDLIEIEPDNDDAASDEAADAADEPQPDSRTD